MTEIQLAHFSFGGDGAERSHMHEVALREARIASEYRGQTVEESPRGLLARLGLPRRLRIAMAGGPATEACNCPA